MATPPAGAQAIVEQFLTRYGLQSLAGWAWSVYRNNGGGDSGLQAITTQLPDTTQFKARFPAYHALAASGRAISINDYLSYENTLRQAFNDHGIHLPTTGPDFSNLVGKLLTNNVSVNEVVTDRIGKAYDLVANAPPEVRDAAARLWGIHGDKALATYFLDPTLSAPHLQQLANAMQIAGSAQQFGIDGVTRARAESLAQLGNTDAGIGNLQHLAQMAPLFQAQVGEQNPLSFTNQGLGAAFGENTTDQQQIQRQLQEREASFKGQGGAAPTQATGVQ